jgi:transcriptional regulator with XRE-family HTH domain
MNLGLMLKNKRIECGMLQEEVANKMGLSQKTISSWERGRTIPKMDDYEKLSRIFGCSINELTGRKDYDLSNLSAHDIIMRLPELDIESLKEISDRAQKIIKDKEERRTLEKRLLAYEYEIKILRRKLGDESN